jgi:2-methylcitrate dehydratase PrpD
MADALDFSDANLAMRGHTTPAVVTTSLALAEALGKSGHDLLLAIVAGVEAECRIGLMVNPPHLRKGFHPTGSLATFGAAAAASHLLDLDASKTAMAIGLAATQAAGLLASGGTMAKPFHSGKAAFNGMMAARLAAGGFVSRPDAVEAPDGFLETHANGILPGADRFDDGAYMISGTIFKSHAACQLTHSTIDNILTLQKQHGVKAGEVETIEVQVPPGYLSVCNIQTPRTGLETKFSLRGMVAMTLLGDDTRDIRSYEDTRATRPELSALCEKVTVVPRKDYSGGTSTAITKLKDGRTITLTCDSYRPAPDIGKQEAAVMRKFRLLATPVLGETSTRALESTIAALEYAPTVRELTGLLAGPQDRK